MITLSNDDNINVYFSKSNLEMPRIYDTSLKSLLETNEANDNSSINIQFKFHNKKAFGVFNGKPWMIDMDQKIFMPKNDSDDAEESNDHAEENNNNLNEKI